MMANNRLFLVCKGCGAKQVLAKSMADGYYVPRFLINGKSFEERLDQFFTDHTWCDKGTKEGGEGEYEIEYEFPIDDGD